jgi:tetratricopeptide (TPR) repeat protein
VKEAVDLVKAYTCEKDARLDFAGLLLDRLGQADEAEKVLRAFVTSSKQPESIFLLIGHLSRRRLPEALDLCEQAWKTCSPEAVALTSVAILPRAQAREADNQRVERWLLAALAKNPRSAQIVAAYAQIQDTRGRHDDAIGLYRRILDRSPDNIVALNNLAYMLAFKEGIGAEALVLAQRAIELAGPNPQLLDTRAVIYLRTGQADRAVQDLQQTMKQSPTPDMYFRLAQAQHLANRPSAAAAAFAKATEAGLCLDALHPLERPGFERLASELKGKGQPTR